MKMFKKFLLLCLAAIIFSTAFSLYGCKKETYSVNMGYTITSLWPEYQEELYEAEVGREKGPVLTKVNNEMTFTVQGLHRISVNISFFIVSDKNKKIVDYLFTGNYNPNEVNYFKGYSIKDGGGQWIDSSLNKTLYDNFTGLRYAGTPYNFELQPVIGEHKLSFTFPRNEQYDIDAQDFTLYIRMSKDSRKLVELKMDENDAYVKYQAGIRELYVLKENDFYVPQISVYDGDKIIPAPIYEWYPFVYGDNPNINVPPTPCVKVWAQKLDGNYMCDSYGVDGYDFIPIKYPVDAGVYLVSYTFTGNKTYQPAEYTCYVVIL